MSIECYIEKLQLGKLNPDTLNWFRMDHERGARGVSGEFHRPTVYSRGNDFGHHMAGVFLNNTLCFGLRRTCPIDTESDENTLPI